jgi:predicted acyl esterase
MSQTAEGTTRTEVRDGMRITWHQPIAMDDGIVLSADVFRPIGDARARDPLLAIARRASGS